jgi:hypothetical protein
MESVQHQGRLESRAIKKKRDTIKLDIARAT